MYGNPYTPTASVVKAIVIFLSLILIGTVVLVLFASGNFGPEADARAQRIKMDAEINEAERRFELEKKMADYKRQQEQAERDFELWLTLKDWGMRVIVLGVMLATIIIAAGKSVQWVYQARQVTQSISIERAASEPSHAVDEALRMRNIYALFEQMNDRIEHLERQVSSLQAQLLVSQQQLECLQMRGDNGSDSSEKIIPFKSVVG